MTADELEAGKDFGRYLDVDGDGIPYRTYPGTHPTKGAYFTRGTTTDRTRATPRRAPAYVDNMQRLLKKFETAQALVPQPVPRPARRADALRRDLLRLDQPGDAEALDELEAARHPRRRAARARLPVPRRRSSDFIARARPGVRGRAEPRRAAAHAARSTSSRIDPAQAGPGPALRRHADHRALHRRATSPRRLGQLKVVAVREGRVMTYIAKPKLHHPSLAKNKARLHAARLRRRDLDAVRRLRPRFDLAPRSSRPATSSTSLPHRVAKLSGIGCSSKTPTYFLGDSPRLQHRARPHAVGADRRQPRQPRPASTSACRATATPPRSASASSPTCMRRGVNMAYIVENNGVYGLTKGQFSATADKGSKSKKGVGQHRRADRPGVARAACWAPPSSRAASPATRTQLVPLIKAAIAHQRRGLPRRHQPVRRLQQPPRLDQELRLRARAQRGGEPPRLHRRAATRSRPSTRPGTVERRAASTTARAAPAQARATDYDPSDKRRRDEPTCRSARHARRGRDRPALRRSAGRRTCTTRSTPVDAPLNALGEAELCPARAALDEGQRAPALTGALMRHQHRQFGVRQDVAGLAAEDHLAQAALGDSALDQEVAA